MFGSKQSSRTTGGVAVAAVLLLYAALLVIYLYPFGYELLVGYFRRTDVCVGLCGTFGLLWLMSLWAYCAACFTPAGFVHQHHQVELQSLQVVPGTCVRRFYPGCAQHCKRCDMLRPERAHHCSDCNKCVMRLDHHCPWIGNCVGVSNHKYFVQFCMYVSLACLFAVATVTPFVAVYFTEGHGQTGSVAGTTYAMGIVCIFGLMGFVALFILTISLGCTHLVMLSQSQTSVEENYPKPNPYSFTKAANFKQIFGPASFAWFLPIAASAGSVDNGITYSYDPAYVTEFDTDAAVVVPQAAAEGESAPTEVPSAEPSDPEKQEGLPAADEPLGGERSGEEQRGESPSQQRPPASPMPLGSMGEDELTQIELQTP
eukprot:GHVU01207866.1.p1 GENE.GHVU01207866.1~~GHVU01207866.1.p1  ORF type:complete len:372 (-),score=46.31 GHVU01207866.1:163-1278(-)